MFLLSVFVLILSITYLCVRMIQKVARYYDIHSLIIMNIFHYKFRSWFAINEGPMKFTNIFFISTISDIDRSLKTFQSFLHLFTSHCKLLSQIHAHIIQSSFKKKYFLWKLNKSIRWIGLVGFMVNIRQEHRWFLNQLFSVKIDHWLYTVPSFRNRKLNPFPNCFAHSFQ